ncbi:MAG TPA: hypothetical protein VH678_05750 [Xanthobacteraceae bacterium]|jgi:hypothetical protein
MTLATYNLPRKQVTSRASWRKLLLSRREELLQRSEHFEELWHYAFPVHDPLTLKYSPHISKAEQCWQSEGWKRVAEWYHRERQGRTLIVETPPAKLAQLQLFMLPNVSLDRAWNQLNNPKNRPTPQVTIEAIWIAVRERGLAALKEPDMEERLSRCDTAARTEIERRIRKHFQPTP